MPIIKNQTATKYIKVEIERDPNITADEYQKLYRKAWITANRDNFNGSSGLTYYKKNYGTEITMRYIVMNNYDYKEAIKSMKMDILIGKLKRLEVPELSKKKQNLLKKAIECSKNI